MQTENTAGAGGFGLPPPELVYPGCTLGSCPCLFIVAGLELILPISF